jgi:hypothetical protein
MHIDQGSKGTYVVLDLTDLTVNGHFPWCAFAGVEPEPYGGALTIERAAVSHVQPDTGG